MTSRSLQQAPAATARDLLRVDHLAHRYGGPDGRMAIGDLDFSVASGELVAIVGPSGCGKSTLLRTVSGLVRPTGGHVSIDGRPVEDVPDDLAIVFQEYGRSLFPWMKVRANAAFPLSRLDLTSRERAERVDESLAAVGLSDTANMYPWQLSGGMQQRLAIARAVAYRPRLLLMDEPFASVDAQTRADLEDLVLDVRRRFGMTILFVTHDIDEAVYLADRVLVLSSSPASVVAALDIDLPTEREQISTRSHPRFVELRTEIASLIRRPAETPLG